MNNKLIHKINRGLRPKKTVEKSSRDDRSIMWKLPLAGIPLMVLLLLPVNLGTTLSIVLVGVGAVLIYMSIPRITQFKLSAAWKTVEGELLYTKVAVENPFAADRAKSYFPYMKYSYKVGRKTYVSDRVANYRELRDFPEEVEALMKQMSTPVLRVYYNPKKHSESLLIADMPLHRKIFWIFIFLLGCSSLAAVII